MERLTWCSWLVYVYESKEFNYPIKIFQYCKITSSYCSKVLDYYFHLSEHVSIWCKDRYFLYSHRKSTSCNFLIFAILSWFNKEKTLRENTPGRERINNIILCWNRLLKNFYPFKLENFHDRLKEISNWKINVPLMISY